MRRHWQSTTLMAPCQRLNHTHPRSAAYDPLRSAVLQPQGLIKLQFRERLCIRTRRVRPLIMTRFRHKV